MSARSGLPSVATAHGIVGFATCACLIVFFAAGGPFGIINDFGNALFGVVSFVLAWLLRPAASRLSGVLVGLAGLGAALTVVGTVLVLSGITGFYLSGLWSSSGFGLWAGTYLLFPAWSLRLAWQNRPECVG